VLNAKNTQVELYKSKPYNQRSLFNKSSIFIIDGLEKLKMLIKKSADDAVIKQKIKIPKYKNKAKRLYYKVGVKS
jgi:hypothetical protein